MPILTPRRPQKRPRANDPAKTHDETRQKLIAAAGEVFAEAGFQSATVRDICARAGTNIAAVNYHFGDKLGLYTEFLKRSAEENGPILESTVSAPDPEEALRRFLHRILRIMCQEGRPSVYVRVMTHELVQPSPALSVVVEHLIQPKARILYGIIGQIIGLPPDHLQTRMCAHSVIGQAMHYVHSRPVLELLWPGFSMTPKMVEEIVDHVTEFSLIALKGIRNKPVSKASSTRR